MARFSQLLQPNNIPLCIYSTFSLSLHLSMILCFHVLAIENNAVVHMGVQPSLWDGDIGLKILNCIFFLLWGCIVRKGRDSPFPECCILYFWVPIQNTFISCVWGLSTLFCMVGLPSLWTLALRGPTQHWPNDSYRHILVPATCLPFWAALRQTCHVNMLCSFTFLCLSKGVLSTLHFSIHILNICWAATVL